MVKTKEEAREILQEIANRNGLLGVPYAAICVLQNLVDYDYLSNDKLFLEFCEEILNEELLANESELLDLEKYIVKLEEEE